MPGLSATQSDGSRAEGTVAADANDGATDTGIDRTPGGIAIYNRAAGVVVIGRDGGATEGEVN